MGLRDTCVRQTTFRPLLLWQNILSQGWNRSYDVNHDGRHKARLVADGHLTDIPVESVHYGVFYLRGIRILVFITDINKMETWAKNIGNGYLDEKTLKKVYIIAGTEVFDRKGHILIISKALYDLQYYVLRWH